MVDRQTRLVQHLGGFFRLRAYPVDRFSDKTAIYYSAELRLMPRWHPLGNMKVLKPLNIDWWQIRTVRRDRQGSTAMVILRPAYRYAQGTRCWPAIHGAEGGISTGYVFF